jgi:hypothetical protein
MTQQIWLLLTYKVPNEPSARRVYVWRKLKRLGAILLHDSIWILPLTPKTREQLQWLSSEIVERGGEAHLLESHFVLPRESAHMIEQFNVQVENAYREILRALAEPEPNLADLSRRYREAHAQDYFHVALGDAVREALISARGEQP